MLKERKKKMEREKKRERIQIFIKITITVILIYMIECLSCFDMDFNPIIVSFSERNLVMKIYL